MHPHLLLLNEQRRMHPEISSFTNKYIYHSLVVDHNSVMKARQSLVALSPFKNRASVLLDVSGTGENCITERASNSRVNLWQLLISFQLIFEYIIAGNKSIGYVTPYRAQALLMDELLEELLPNQKKNRDIISATVHRFQGSEREVMIFDIVDSYAQARPGLLLAGDDSERLINVAVTRTKGKFIHVCDMLFVREKVTRDKTIRKLVEHQLENNQIVTLNEIGTWIKNQHPNLKWLHARNVSQVLKDIKYAKNRIVLAISNVVRIGDPLRTALIDRPVGVELLIISSKLDPDIKADKFLEDSSTFPFILIDTTILWFGIFSDIVPRVQPPYVAARLDSEYLAQYMLKYFSIDK